ncbi:Na/Pi cotransporter family protein [Celeribacter halophilus]|uniref:Na/Pi cotransporter family protein n=1 Tax=Celeribacter halophilus TaxID=576117 RepID=UPI003A936C52
MVIVAFITGLAGATMLLLFSVRLVRTGIERAHGASFQRLLRNQKSLAGAGLSGVSLAVIMQSSAAVALLAAGFVSSGYLTPSMALAIVLGGDLGSALVVQILSFPIDWIIAPLLAVGGWLAVKAEGRKARQYGRIIMGIALILVSLNLLRQTVEPVRDSAFLPAVASYLERDFITGFIVGAVLAFVMHSGVATILAISALVHLDALSLTAGIPILLGANLGSGFIPVWLTRGMDVEARRLVFSNLAARGLFAIFLLAIALFTPLVSELADLSLRPAQTLVLAHIGFNLCVLGLTLPFCRSIETIACTLMPDPQTSTDSGASIAPPSLLATRVDESPKLAITSLKQELLRMHSNVETMFQPALDMYVEDNAELRNTIRSMDKQVNQALSDIREFVARIPRDSYSKADARTARDMVEYAIRLESAGDVVSSRMTKLAERLHTKGASFSKEGLSELVHMHESILANFKLAANVLISDDPESARMLSLEKTEVKRVERDSRKRHLKRLQNGKSESFETSDIHLETLRALREVNSHISAVAYPILYQTGQLLETRLIQDMPESA